MSRSQLVVETIDTDPRDEGGEEENECNNRNKEDIRLKQTRNQNLSGYFTKASDVVGRTLKKTLSVDQVLLSRHLEIDWDIRKGQKIIIQSIAGPVTIENSGVARG